MFPLLELKGFMPLCGDCPGGHSVLTLKNIIEHGRPLAQPEKWRDETFRGLCFSQCVLNS
jgi:hypothetical protein